MPIEGISHITLIVKDIESSANLFESVLGAQEVYSSDGRQFSLSREKYFILGGVWIALMEGPSLPDNSYNHVAFKIPISEPEVLKNRLKSAEVEFREDRPRIQGEGYSIYFYDFDKHLFELHTGTIDERLKTYNNHLKYKGNANHRLHFSAKTAQRVRRNVNEEKNSKDRSMC